MPAPPSIESTANSDRMAHTGAPRWRARAAETPVTAHSRGRSSGGRSTTARTGRAGRGGRAGRAGRGDATGAADAAGAAGDTAGTPGAAGDAVAGVVVDMRPSHHTGAREGMPEREDQGSIRGSPHGGPPHGPARIDA